MHFGAKTETVSKCLDKQVTVHATLLVFDHVNAYIGSQEKVVR